MSLFRRTFDRLAAALDLAGLWVLDRLAGPMPKTLADEIRERQEARRRERIRRAFPGLLHLGDRLVRKPNDR